MTMLLTSLALMWLGGLLFGIGVGVRWMHYVLRKRDDTIIKALNEETARLRAQVAKHIGS